MKSAFLKYLLMMSVVGFNQTAIASTEYATVSGLTGTYSIGAYYGQATLKEVSLNFKASSLPQYLTYEIWGNLTTPTISSVTGTLSAYEHPADINFNGGIDGIAGWGTTLNENLPASSTPMSMSMSKVYDQATGNFYFGYQFDINQIWLNGKPSVPSSAYATFYNYSFFQNAQVTFSDRGQVTVDGARIGNSSDKLALSDSVTSPVSEPETYAMLLAGLGLISAAVKRRKVQQA